MIPLRRRTESAFIGVHPRSLYCSDEISGWPSTFGWPSTKDMER
jgi:hypothetical protein